MVIFFKRLIIALICLFLIIGLCHNYICYANDEYFKADQFDNNNSESADSTMRNITGAILNIVRVFCVGLALIMLTVLSIKFMMASPEGRADIKSSAIKYIVGAVVLFAASSILTIIYNMSKNIQGNN